MLKAVLFDLYGTLLQIPHDVRPIGLVSVRSPIRHSVAIDIAVTRSNPTLREYARNIGLPPQADIDKLQQQLDAHLQRIRPFDDVFEVLEHLKNRGIKMAVISNLSSPYCQPFFECGLDRFFDEIVFSCQCRLRKPNPRIYQLALEKLAVDAAETMMVGGDSLKSDVRGPNGVGITGVHLIRDAPSSADHPSIASLRAVPDICGCPL